MLLPLALSVSFLLQKTAIAVEAPRQQPAQTSLAPFISMADPPKLPKVDLNSCPFEGCQFGKWAVKAANVVVYSTWNSARKPITTLAKDDEVTALTAVNVVLQPGKGIFDHDV